MIGREPDFLSQIKDKNGACEQTANMQTGAHIANFELIRAFLRRKRGANPSQVSLPKTSLDD